MAKQKDSGIRLATGNEVFEKDSNGKAKVKDGISIRHTMEKSIPIKMEIQEFKKLM